MKSAPTIAGVLLVALQAACASSGNYNPDNPSSQEFPAPPPDVMAIHTYWTGQQPPCPVVRVMDLSAGTENGLRWGAWNARAQAVVSVRTRNLDSRPGTGRVYEGVAVRFAEGCTPPADSASKT
jgi:hypothetical protein